MPRSGSNYGRRILNRDTRLSDVLHVLLHMAQTDAPLTSDVLARSMGTNPAVFRRTMAGLREAGLVRAERGHGGGWRLARPLEQITLLSVYKALGRPTLFAIGNRGTQGDCLVERNVHAAIAETMEEATRLFERRFGALTLSQIAPKVPVPASIHAE
jgi:DNA-binding IscR family transcriptional regulator